MIVFDENKKVKKRLKIRNVSKNIYLKNGIGGYFIGVNALILRALPVNIVTFTMYEIVFQALQANC